MVITCNSVYIWFGVNISKFLLTIFKIQKTLQYLYFGLNIFLSSDSCLAKVKTLFLFFYGKLNDVIGNLKFH